MPNTSYPVLHSTSSAHVLGERSRGLQYGMSGNHSMSIDVHQYRHGSLSGMYYVPYLYVFLFEYRVGGSGLGLAERPSRLVRCLVLKLCQKIRLYGNL